MRLVFIALAAALAAGCATPPLPQVRVEVLAINDFHGNLLPPGSGIRVRDPADPAKTVRVAAGGAEYLASEVAALEAQNPNHVFVAAGDLIGASPLLSALFHDEPTIESLSAMGLEFSAVGNHEFDKGAAELLRMQNGGCHPVDGCRGPHPFTGATFRYLAASTVVEASGRTLFPAFGVKRFEGVPVAFIGLTLKETPSIVVPSGVAGLRFGDEADTVNALVPEIERQGIHAIVLLIHQGGEQAGDYDECRGLVGEIVGIVKRLAPAVAVVISGHTHRAYNCRIDGRLVTSADKYGTLVTKIDLVLDRASGRIASAEAHNQIVRDDGLPKDTAQTALIAAYQQRAEPLARRVVGPLAAALTRTPDSAGESPLGDAIADAQLEATRGADAQVALMNPGGIRASLARPEDGLLRYEDLFTVQPFQNNLVTMTLSGAELQRALEQQWQGSEARILQVSAGLHYRWDARRARGERVLPGSLTLDGRPIAPGDPVRVTVNSFMASGGDNFSVFTRGRELRTGVMDVDALERYFKRGAAPAPRPRIEREN